MIETIMIIFEEDNEIFVKCSLPKASGRGNPFELVLGVELLENNNVFFELDGRDRWLKSVKISRKDRFRIVKKAIDMWEALKYVCKESGVTTLSLNGEMVDEKYPKRLDFYLNHIGFNSETLEFKIDE